MLDTQSSSSMLAVQCKLQAIQNSLGLRHNIAEPFFDFDFSNGGSHPLGCLLAKVILRTRQNAIQANHEPRIYQSIPSKWRQLELISKQRTTPPPQILDFLSASTLKQETLPHPRVPLFLIREHGGMSEIPNCQLGLTEMDTQTTPTAFAAQPIHR